MLRKLFDTRPDWAPLIQRVLLGIVFVPHGAQKLLGWFGGSGFSGTMEHFTQSMGIPAFLAFLVIMTESFGAISLILGFLSRICVLGIGSIMVVATFMIHLQYGFFMNWFGQKQGEGFEYHILALALCLGILITGGGKFSIDRLIAGRLEKRGEREDMATV